MKKPALIIIMLCAALTASTQTYKGIIKDINGKGLPFANVVLYALPDSTFVNGVITNDLGEFTFESKTIEAGYLKVSFIGYETATVPLHKDKIETIILNPTTNQLSEVEVVSRRPVIKQIAGKLIISIKGTSLSEAGNLMDVLQKTPGLQVKNGIISVFGKGKPIIFINGREIKNNAELESLQSDDIANIEIDRNPSARYSAAGNAVVRVTTRKITRDRIHIQVYDRAYFARKFSNISGLQMNSKWNKTQVSVNYSYMHQQSKDYEDAYEINTQAHYTIKNKSFSVMEPKTKRHNLFAGVHQKLGKKHTLGAQYSYISSDREDLTQGNQDISKTNTPSIQRFVLKNGNNYYNLSVYSVNYEFKIDSINSLQALADYTKSTSNGNENIAEQNRTNATLQKSNIANINNYDVYSAKIDYNTNLFGKLPLQTGIKFSQIENGGSTLATDILQQTEKYFTSNTTTDRIGAGYILLSPQINKWEIEAGLRCEYIDRNIVSTGINVLDSSYAKWFPTFNISHRFSDDYNVNFSYAKKIQRPAFWELNSNRNYIDSLAYSTGNPRLKASISHNIDMNITLFGNLFLDLGYEYEEQARILSAISDANNPDIVVYTPVNIDKAAYFRASANYDWSYKFWKSTVSLGIEQPFMKIPYLGKYKNIKKLSYYFQTNNDFKISDKLTFFCNFSYYSASEDLMSYYYDNYNLSSGINASLFDNKLKVSLYVNDILNASETAWKDQYGNIESYSDQDRDRTYLRLSIKYNINKYKGGIRKQTAGKDEIDRI
ncbi:MAG: hypothetical protein CSA36_02125 [Draconibacterium sp.]|nr:MAG: hypothetical protein CSA36_02125 [Draconibacterium sp.]